jgi:methylmalonyl-CoA mutase N-terminal domain/subunit
VEAAAVELMDKVAELGGAVAAIENGFQKSEIERSAYRIANEIDAGERVVVGVNKFTIDTDEPYEPLRVNPLIEAEQRARLETLRAERGDISALLEAVRAAARGSENVLYPMKEALKARATVGEVSTALRDVWGEYVPHDVF